MEAQQHDNMYWQIKSRWNWSENTKKSIFLKKYQFDKIYILKRFVMSFID